MADCRTFFTSRAMRRGLVLSMMSAAAAFLPRIICATRLSLRGEVRIERAIAIASLSGSLLGLLCLLILAFRLFGFLVDAAMHDENAGRREFAQLVADHVLGDRYRQKFMAVMHAKGEADELRQDGGAARPGLDDVVPARRAHLVRLLKQVSINERSFPY